MQETYLKALQRAVQVQGLDVVATLIARPVNQVRAWLAGRAPIPDSVFLRIVDLIVANDPVSISEDDVSEFRVITDAEFQAFSRTEKLSYLRSAIRAHEQFAKQRAAQADESERELLGIVRRELPMDLDEDARINPDEEDELDYWSEKLGVSREELRKAVQAAGPMVKDVQRHLGH